MQRVKVVLCLPDVRKSSTHRTGFQVESEFKLTQHSKDEQLMKYLIYSLDCGKVIVRSNKLACDYKINKFTDLIHKVIPFFTQYPLQEAKSKDFSDFMKVAELMQKKAHLTEEGWAPRDVCILTQNGCPPPLWSSRGGDTNPEDSLSWV